MLLRCFFGGEGGLLRCFFGGEECFFGVSSGFVQIIVPSDLQTTSAMPFSNLLSLSVAAVKERFLADSLELVLK